MFNINTVIKNTQNKEYTTFEEARKDIYTGMIDHANFAWASLLAADGVESITRGLTKDKSGIYCNVVWSSGSDARKFRAELNELEYTSKFDKLLELGVIIWKVERFPGE